MNAAIDGPRTRPASRRPAERDIEEQLAPVRTAVSSEAEAVAERLVEDARAAAERTVADARQDAERAIGARRAQLDAAARARAETALARARHEQRAAVLAAESELRDELARRVHVAVADLRDDPRFPELLDHLEQLAREQLGDGALVERDPDGAGGLVATAGGRRVDYRLDALATRAFDAVGAEVASLWA
jgi:vacuolar-type H+-ATPase subunit E/Vma4